MMKLVQALFICVFFFVIVAGSGCTSILPTKRVVIEENSVLPDERADAEYETKVRKPKPQDKTFQPNRRRNY